MPRFLFEDTTRSPSESGPLDAASVRIPPGKRPIRGRTYRTREPRLTAVADAVSNACASAGVHPRIMGIGPVEAVPKALRQAGMNLSQIDLVELNEAFASQAIAVVRKLEIDPAIVNINGGAIALGHPLGCTGSKLTIQLVNDMKRLNKKYGIVTACVGGGQGIAGIIENLN